MMPGAFGIINGRAVFLERQMGVAWVDVHSTDQDIRIDRFPAGSGHGTTGIAFRVADVKNWGYLYVDEISALTPDLPRIAYLGLVINGTQGGNVTFLTPPTDNWTRLRVVTNGATITGYIDDGRGGWTMIGMLSGKPAATNATGAGLAGAPGYQQAYSLWRADNFTVCSPGGC